jgi:hypothetical protein
MTPDYSINTGAGSGATAGATGILTINGPMSLQSVPTYAAATQRTGTWQHAYFEARIQFSATVSGSSSAPASWPAFWTYAIQGQAPVAGQKTAECDILEQFPNGGAGASSQAVNTLHNWQNTSSSSAGTDLYNTDSMNLQVSLQGSTESAQPADGAWHTYGCLWTGNGTTGSVQFYYDNHLIVHQDGMSTFPTGAGTGLTAQEADNMFLVMGSAQGWPMNIDWVRVWQ